MICLLSLNKIHEGLRKTLLIASLVCCGVALSAQNTVTGTVADENGVLSGVTVVVKGTNVGVLTGENGGYSIDVPDNNAALVFSLLGFATQEIVVGNRTLVNVQMQETVETIEEVVVLGYGAKARKADLSASIGTIERMDIVKQRPVSGVGGMLQGQISGVTVRNETGDPTKEQSIVIRGQGSRGNESVLIVVDGVPGANYNVDEVESIVVLKDAASAAIYGAYSGSAGVIMVTTKKAKTGTTSVSYDGTFGVNHPVNLPQSLSAEEQRRVREQSHKAAGVSLPDGWDTAKNPYIATTRTDWIDLVFRNALFQRHTVALSGGSETLGNRLSLNYIKNEGTLLNTFKESVQLRYNAMFKPAKWIKISEDAWFTTGRSRGTTEANGYDGTLQRALAMPRSAEAYYSDGTIGGTVPKDPAYTDKYGNFSNIHGDIQNPLRGLTSNTEHKLPIDFNSSTFLEVADIIDGLRFTSRFTYRLHYDWNKMFVPRVPEPGKSILDNELAYSAGREQYWESENTLNYDRTFGAHTIGALVSTTLNSMEGRNFGVAGRTFDRESETFQYLNYAKSYDTPTDSYAIDRNLAYVGRLSYSYANRYFVTASMRRDYAGRLPKGKKYGDFPSVTAAWKLSEESFMPKSDVLNLLKLRGSWGRIGNLGSIATGYGTPAYNIFSYVNYSGSGGGMIGKDNPMMSMGVTPSAAFNSNLTWETSEQLDFGLDLKLFGDRLSFSADWFNKMTYNLIKTQDYGWPSNIGIGAPTINEGKIVNTGVEFSLGWNDKAGEIDYFVSANVSVLKNKIADIGAVDPTTGKKADWRWGNAFRSTLQPFRSREGDPLYSYWLVKTDGIFRTDADAAAHVDKNGNRIQPNAVAGDLKFVDKNGDGKINDDDKEYLGSYFPTLTGALTAGLVWKNLTFSFMLQGVQGAKIFHAFKLVMLNEANQNYNRWNRILDAFPNTNEVPRMTVNDVNNNFGTNSDWYLEDGSYMRLKNVMFAYDFTSILQKSAHFKNRKSGLSLSFSADNLLTFTKYSGIDPEVGGNGMDGGVYPLSATFSIGIKLTY